MSWRSALLVSVALGAACSKPAEEAEVKQWPTPLPSSKDVQIPKDLSISVTVDGSPKPPITAETLRTTKPDFVDEERKAWRIPTLVTGPVGAVEASSPAGISVKFPQPTADLEPILFLTRRGELIVSAVDPKDPFPRHHGQGGRLHRPGDSLPRVAPVAKLDIKRSTP